MMIIFGIVAIAATVITLFARFWWIVGGRFIHGAATGIMVSAGVKMHEETIPTLLLNKYGVYPNAYMNLGIMVTLLLGAGLNTKEPKSDWWWKVCYGAPIPILSLGILLLSTVFTEDSINFLVNQSDKEAALRAIKKIYNDDAEARY